MDQAVFDMNRINTIDVAIIQLLLHHTTFVKAKRTFEYLSQCNVSSITLNWTFAYLSKDLSLILNASCDILRGGLHCIVL